MFQAKKMPHQNTTYIMMSLSLSLFFTLTYTLIDQSIQAEALPLVERVDKEDGKFLGVHVPLFYDMNLDKKNTTGESTMNINVLSGLVRVFRDRVKGPDGKYTGPLQVSVFGTPVYDNSPKGSVSSSSPSWPQETNRITSQSGAAVNLPSGNGGNGGVAQVVGDIFTRIGEMFQSFRGNAPEGYVKPSSGLAY